MGGDDEETKKKNRMKRGGRERRTPAPGGVASPEQEIGGGGGGSKGGEAEEVDRDGVDDGGEGPCWAEMTRKQKKNRMKRDGRERRRPAPGGVASPAQRDDDDRHLPGH